MIQILFYYLVLQLKYHLLLCSQSYSSLFEASGNSRVNFLKWVLGVKAKKETDNSSQQKENGLLKILKKNEENEIQGNNAFYGLRKITSQRSCKAQKRSKSISRNNSSWKKLKSSSFSSMMLETVHKLNISSLRKPMIQLLAITNSKIAFSTSIHHTFGLGSSTYIVSKSSETATIHNIKDNLTEISRNESMVTHVETAENENLSQKNYSFTLLQEDDGHVTDADGIPERYLMMQKYNRAKAKAALEKTLKWRETNDIDNILTKPHIQFDLVKYSCPHYFSGYDNVGNIIFVQQLGLFDLPLTKQLNVPLSDILYHYVYIMEYCWNVLCPLPVKMINILNLQGLLGWKVLFQDKELRSYIQKITACMSEHYPSRSYKTFIINAPFWFSAIFLLVKPLLRESTKKKIEIFGENHDAIRKALEPYLGDKISKEEKDSFFLELFQQKIMNNNTLARRHPSEIYGVHSPIEQEIRSFCVNQTQKFDLNLNSFEKIVE